MFTRLHSLEECVGKTVARAEGDYGTEISLVFTDETYIWGITERIYEDECEVRFDAPITPTTRFTLGVITKEEFDAETAAERQRIVERRAEDERAEFERLKAKFGNS